MVAGVTMANQLVGCGLQIGPLFRALETETDITVLDLRI